MNAIYRNRRTSNGLKRGVHAEWDAPKPKQTPKPKFDVVKFLTECANDKEAYSDKERAGFRKAVDEIETLQGSVRDLESLLWNKA